MYQRKTNKYGAKKTTVDDIKFDSRLEAKFYEHLCSLRDAKLIKGFEMQVRYEVIPAYVSPTGKKIRKTEYVADFDVHHLNGDIETVDVKGVETDVFKIKRKLFEKIYNRPLVCVNYSKIDGGWVTLEQLKEARKKRKSSR